MYFLFTMSDNRLRRSGITHAPKRNSLADETLEKEVRHSAQFALSALNPSMRPLHNTLTISRMSRLVEPDGIEPTTSCLQSTRSPN